MSATSPGRTSWPFGHRSPVTGSVYNIASARETSLLELASMLASAMDRSDLESVFGPARKVNPVSRRLADTTAARRDLGWGPEITLEQGLSDLVAWWREETGENQL